MPTVLAIDVMSGDHGPEELVPAVIRSLEGNPRFKVIMVGDRERVESVLKRQNVPFPERLSIVHADQVVGMDESPVKVLRSKKNSSMRVAIDLVAAGEAQACVSSGNTGALMAMAFLVLKTLEGVERPAIATWLPAISGQTLVLDLGANIQCSAAQLFQFGVMASVLVESVRGQSRPSIGLLNVGTEALKGNDLVQAADGLFRESDLNYQGFVEGSDIFLGRTDIVVCDGFVGNIALKASEGVSQLVLHTLRSEFGRGLFSRAAALAARKVLNTVRDRLDHRRYNGASLLGLQGIVVKSHGSSDAFAFEYAITEALAETEKHVPEHIGDRLKLFLQDAAVA